MFKSLPESGSRPFILDDDDGFRALRKQPQHPIDDSIALAAGSVCWRRVTGNRHARAKYPGDSYAESHEQERESHDAS
jgi:hypothetical protein